MLILWKFWILLQQINDADMMAIERLFGDFSNIKNWLKVTGIALSYSIYDLPIVSFAFLMPMLALIVINLLHEYPNFN